MPKRPERMEKLLPYGLNTNKSVNLVGARLGDTSMKIPQPDSVDGSLDMAKRLMSAGGFAQQQRMIKDKRHSLDQATKYSYQAAWVRKCAATEVETKKEKNILPPVRALMNPNKLKQDYDDKIISVGFEHHFECGDIFEWKGTETYWLIYLQDLTELAYFRGDIRKCSHQINWEDENGKHSTYAAIRGPVETKINYIQKHGISVDNPNYSLNILLPKTADTLSYFQRYNKFYLADDELKVCWRIEAIDWLSMPGVLEINAVEYYTNEFEDNLEDGTVGTLKTEPINPNNSFIENTIVGETFIKPKREYEYEYIGNLVGKWSIKENYPIELIQDGKKVKLRWLNTYSGQFDLIYANCFKKTIVVQSLF